MKLFFFKENYDKAFKRVETSVQFFHDCLPFAFIVRATITQIAVKEKEVEELVQVSI